MNRKHAVIIGSGAGGSTVAKDLQGEFDVTLLEAGGEFKRLKLSRETLDRLKKTGLLFTEREIQFAFPCMKVRKTYEGMVLVNGKSLGGSTVISTGSCTRSDRPLRRLGIDLSPEFAELEKEIPQNVEHQRRWSRFTRDLLEECEEMGLEPTVTTRMTRDELCNNCGRCIFGCPKGAKWDSREFIKTAEENGAKVVDNCRVDKIRIEGNDATGVEARSVLKRRFFPADLIVVAAGGFATPTLLTNSGIPVNNRLFVEPVVCLAAYREEVNQTGEVPMPFIIEKEGYIISPYFDYLSYYFNRSWKYPGADTLSLMIKLADTEDGTVTGSGPAKRLSERDRNRLAEAEKLVKDILVNMGIDRGKIFKGTLNAGHPGGTLPITLETAENFHDPVLPENVYVADGSLFPNSVGKPHILTIAAMAKRVGKICKKMF